jgi:hypothetical protein
MNNKNYQINYIKSLLKLLRHKATKRISNFNATLTLNELLN